MKLLCSRVKIWGSTFGKELWESLSVATRRDTIQQVKMAKVMISRMMMLNMGIAVAVVLMVMSSSCLCHRANSKPLLKIIT